MNIEVADLIVSGTNINLRDLFPEKDTTKATIEMVGIAEYLTRILSEKGFSLGVSFHNIYHDEHNPRMEIGHFRIRPMT